MEHSGDHRYDAGTGPDAGAADGAAPAARRGLTRKNLLKAAVAAVPLPLLMGSVALARDAKPVNGELEPTPYCDDGDEPTIPQMEGPYFKPNSPLRSSLVDAGTQGTRLTVSGYVFGLTCQPIANALLDFWQADVNGAYDNVGFRFRGHQFTDSRGAFKLSTIVPGLYPGRTRHIHVKVQAPNQPILTTQLYFPGEPRNNTDTIFDPRLLMNVRNVGTAKEATFDFVLRVRGQQPTGQPTGQPTQPGGTWAAGTAYRQGDQVTYNGVSYQCIQAHTAQPGWEPPSAPSLWRAA
ncbi:carbohydrate-binding protein [Streptomyces sp. NPDC003077]|uniref:dioxygenase family protein n=1 Tax=Streptomyces sp. NPDC003077 TaxID=3154443 RepID=UPI0033BF7A3B